MQKKLKKFKNKVLFTLVIISLAPLLIISAVNLWAVIKSRQTNIAEMQELAITNVIVETKKFLNQQIESLNLVVSGATTADGQPVKNLKEININNLIILIKQVKETAKEVEEVNFVNDDGVIVRINRDNFIMVKKTYAEGVELVHQNVSVVDSINDGLITSPLYRTALAGKNYFGSIEFADNQPRLQLGSQIENQNRQIIGVIAATVNLGPVQTIVNKTRLGETGFVYLADKQGNVLAGPASKLNTQINLERNPLVGNVLAGSVYNGLLRFTVYEDADKENVIFAGRSLGTIDWFVLSEWPEKDAFSVIQSILTQLIYFTLAVFVLVIGLSFFLVQKIVKPIKILKEGAKQITDGNLDYKIDLKTDDEFETLGNKFNEMIGVLKQNKNLKDEFVFIAAHELRTPVTAIKGYLSMILEGSFGKLPPKADEPLKTVYNANERLVQLIQDLLEVARSDSGKMAIKLKPMKLAESINLVITELTPLANNKNIKINYRSAAEEFLVLADSYKIKEVLINLIGNAIKYTINDGGIEIYHEVGTDGQITTHIKDHGIGMSAEAMQKLFSKFYRVKTDQTAKIEGTGLGLFICKEIIERLGGKIWAESIPGQGSAFSFSLKRAESL